MDMSGSVTREAPRLTSSFRKPTTFLCLAPVHSASFPKQPESSKSATTTNTGSAVDSPPPSPMIRPASIRNRRSSTSSIGSVNEKRRFLKLGPVFWGGAIGEDDYAIED
ncbi:hypothetical protein Q9L58_008254 [Maublancomyces gigas]|uniref:Uncharacterized protein n=1 Tax=Discina gigas TaxID=1032678 RepID=A0ABR3GAB2_9PEZI